MRAFGCSAKSRKLIERRLARRVAEDNDRPLRLDPCDRRGERGSAGGFEDQAESPLRLVDTVDDRLGAAHMSAALRRSRRPR